MQIKNEAEDMMDTVVNGDRGGVLTEHIRAGTPIVQGIINPKIIAKANQNARALANGDSGLSPKSIRSPRRKSLTKVNVSSRVDVILNNDLFKKHLSRHGDVLEKLSVGRRGSLAGGMGGLKKAHSNLDLTNIDLDEKVERPASTTKEMWDVPKDENNRVDNSIINKPTLPTNRSQRRHLSLVEQKDLQKLSDELARREEEQAKSTQAKKTSASAIFARNKQSRFNVPSFADFKKQRQTKIVSGHIFAKTVSAVYNDEHSENRVNIKHKSVSSPREINCDSLRETTDSPGYMYVDEENESENLDTMTKADIEIVKLCFEEPQETTPALICITETDSKENVSSPHKQTSANTSKDIKTTVLNLSTNPKGFTKQNIEIDSASAQNLTRDICEPELNSKIKELNKDIHHTIDQNQNVSKQQEIDKSFNNPNTEANKSDIDLLDIECETVSRAKGSKSKLSCNDLVKELQELSVQSNSVAQTGQTTKVLKSGVSSETENKSVQSSGKTDSNTVVKPATSAKSRPKPKPKPRTRNLKSRRDSGLLPEIVMKQKNSSKMDTPCEQSNESDSSQTFNSPRIEINNQKWVSEPNSTDDNIENHTPGENCGLLEFDTSNHEDKCVDSENSDVFLSSSSEFDSKISSKSITVNSDANMAEATTPADNNVSFQDSSEKSSSPKVEIYPELPPKPVLNIFDTRDVISPKPAFHIFQGNNTKTVMSTDKMHRKIIVAKRKRKLPASRRQNNSVSSASGQPLNLDSTQGVQKHPPVLHKSFSFGGETEQILEARILEQLEAHDQSKKELVSQNQTAESVNADKHGSNNKKGQRINIQGRKLPAIPGSPNKTNAVHHIHSNSDSGTFYFPETANIPVPESFNFTSEANVEFGNNFQNEQIKSTDQNQCERCNSESTSCEECLKGANSSGNNSSNLEKDQEHSSQVLGSESKQLTMILSSLDDIFNICDDESVLNDTVPVGCSSEGGYHGDVSSWHGERTTTPSDDMDRLSPPSSLFDLKVNIKHFQSKFIALASKL